MRREMMSYKGNRNKKIGKMKGEKNRVGGGVGGVYEEKCKLNSG